MVCTFIAYILTINTKSPKIKGFRTFYTQKFVCKSYVIPKNRKVKNPHKPLYTLA